jgi:hypothetical protein
MTKLGLGAGRPSEKRKVSMADEMPADLVRINAQVSTAHREKLKIYCVKNKTSITDLLRDFIDKLPE